MATIQVRVDDNLKNESDILFKQLGIDTTTAIRIFLTQSVIEQGIPFEIKKVNRDRLLHPLSEEEFIEQLLIGRRDALKGNYKESKDVIKNLRDKYDL
jgi:DNA-damage-inducible protein J